MADELGPKKMIIIVDVASGKVDAVNVAGGGVKTDPVPPAEIDAVLTNDPTPVGQLIWGRPGSSLSSSNCLYWWQGRWMKVC